MVAIFPSGFKIDQRYEVLKALGSGLSGEVLLVQDGAGLKALKLLKTVQLNLSAAEALANFKREFTILKELNHPHIARIMDFGLEPKLRKYYFTTEFITGAELHRACEGQAFATIEKLILQVLRALNYLHTRGIYHYDIKPQNILVQLDEKEPTIAKIIDFGLAGFAAPGKKVGTPAYMAPEVIRGDRLDGRADVYSMGALIYRLLTGQNPFVTKSLKETLDRQLHFMPPPPSSVIPTLPEWWDRIVSRMLEKNPDRRYAQAAHIIRDLNFLSNRTYEIETADTRLSYLPESGTLVGRDTEWLTFTKLFSLLFESNARHDDRILIVAGEKGTGKTRFLREIRHFAQLRNIPVRTLQEYREQDKPAKFILTLDDGRLDLNTVNALVQELAKEQCLIIWASEIVPQRWHSPQIIRLGNFDKTQLKLYLESVTGLRHAPPTLIDGIYQRTRGNPFFVAEFIKALMRENVLFDSSAGKWNAETFDDVRIDFDQIRLPATIEEAISAQLADLSQHENEILSLLTVNGEPLAGAQLAQLLTGQSLSEALLNLVGSGLVELTAEKTYAINNILFAGVLLRSLSEAQTACYHDRLARIFAPNSADEEIYLTHIGYGSDQGKAISALQRLSGILLSRQQFEKAAAVCQKLIHFGDKRPDIVNKALFDLGQCHLNSRNLPAALACFQTLKEESYPSDDPQNVENALKIFFLLIGIHIKMGNLSQAQTLIADATKLADKSVQIKINSLILDNFRGSLLFKQGRIDDALALLQASYAIWLQDLNLEEKALVENDELFEVLSFKKDYHRIITLIESHLPVLNQLDNAHRLARSYYSLGEAYRVQASFDNQQETSALFSKALAAFEQAESLARKTRNQPHLLRVYNGIGNTYLAQDRLQDALSYYERALNIAQKVEIGIAAGIAINIANIHKTQGRYDDAYSLLIYSLNTLENLSNRTPEASFQLFSSHFEMAEVHIERGETAKAHHCLDRAAKIHADNGFRIYRFWVPFLRAQTFWKEERADESRRELAIAETLIENDFEKNAFAQFRARIAAPDETPSLSRLIAAESVATPPATTAPQATPAIETRHDALQTILHINQALNSDLDLDNLCKLVLNYALCLSRAEAGFILLRDESGAFEVRCAQNKTPGAEKRISFSIAREAVASNRAVIAADAGTDERFQSAESVVQGGARSVFCLPLRARGKTIGVFYLDNSLRKNAFADCDMTLLSAFCEQVGIALENARIIGELTAARNQLQSALNKTTQELTLARKEINLDKAAYQGRFTYPGILTQSPAMFRVFNLLDKITETSLAAHIRGASGTGKELIAKALHANHPARRDRRFVAVNCSAIPAPLMESELFGHKAGSFTGADRDRIGLIEMAGGGTLFLDEIADLDPGLQVKLLRFLQEGEIRKVGSNQDIKVDVRVVCASHQSLEELVRAGKFREDLYYRLCQVKIELPALAERREDIPLLLQHFIAKFRAQNGVTDPIAAAPEFVKALLDYAWPGNVRELENLVLVACALRDGTKLTLESLPTNTPLFRKSSGMTTAVTTELNCNPANRGRGIPIDAHNDFDPTRTWSDYENLILAKCYEFCGRKKTPTARRLGLSHTTVYNRVAELGLDDPQNPLYQINFTYDERLTLANYLLALCQASLAYHDNRPYAAIRQLGISQGYFYKVMKRMNYPGVARDLS